MTMKLAMVAVLATLVACGGSSGGPTAPTPTPTPISKAIVTLNLDPKVQTAESQGNGYWRFKVNAEFVETGGAVGFTLNSIRSTLRAPSGTILLDNDSPFAAHVSAGGRTVYQYTSPLYYTNFTTGQANLVILGNITDDKGNSLTVSNNMSVQHVAGTIELP